MKIKGIKEWRNHLPGLTGKKILIVPLIALTSVLGTWLFYFILDNLSRWFPSPDLILIEPYLPILGPLIALTCAIILIYSVWSRREKLLKKDKATGYEYGFKRGFAGISILIATIIHIYDPIMWFPFKLISFPPPVNPLTFTLSSSIWDLLGQNITLDTPLFQVIPGILLFAFGLSLLIRSIETFGFDYVTVVYLYYPEESHLVDYKIYSIVRNPVYASALIMGFGGLIFRFSVYAAIIWGLFYVGLLIHIHFVEDKELIQRFGNSFKEYQQNVPSLFVRPRNWGKLILFLFGKWT